MKIPDSDFPLHILRKVIYLKIPGDVSNAIIYLKKEYTFHKYAMSYIAKKYEKSDYSKSICIYDIPNIHNTYSLFDLKRLCVLISNLHDFITEFTEDEDYVRRLEKNMDILSTWIADVFYMYAN